MTPVFKVTIIHILVILKLISIINANSFLESQYNDLNIDNNNETRMSRLKISRVSIDPKERQRMFINKTLEESESGRGMMNHDYHDLEEPKSQKPWLGYYDFLITEGSYKFWVVFQLFTIAILIYSAFAAIYYAKYTINDYENYDDYLFGRSARSVPPVPPKDTAFLGLPVETYLRIYNAVANYGNKQ